MSSESYSESSPGWGLFFLFLGGDGEEIAMAEESGGWLADLKDETAPTDADGNVDGDGDDKALDPGDTLDGAVAAATGGALWGWRWG